CETLRLSAVPALSPDFPVFAVASTQLGLLYLFSKHGQLIICDLPSCVQLMPQQCITRVGQSLLCARLDNETQGVIVICRDGRVLMIEPQINYLIEYLMRQGGKMLPIARRLQLASTRYVFEMTRL